MRHHDNWNGKMSVERFELQTNSVVHPATDMAGHLLNSGTPDTHVPWYAVLKLLY